MGYDREDSSSTTSIVIGVLVGLVVIVGLCGGLLVFGGLFFYTSLESQPMQIQIEPQATEQAETLESLPRISDGQPNVSDGQTNAADPQPAPQSTAEPLRPAKEEAMEVAKELLLAKLTVDPANVAWSAPTVTATEDGGYQVIGAFTADGISHGWSCTLELHEIDGRRQWKCGRLEVDGKSQLGDESQ